jgi:hypothetical protein
VKVKVFFTVDVEIWCNGWQDLDARFPEAFRRYVYGPTRHGQFGLTRTLQQLCDHGLKGVFFTEPLFSTRFGTEPLTELVGLIEQAGQEVQLHLHTEWADEASPPLLPGLEEKRQHLCMFDRTEQGTLIELGQQLLRDAGVGRINAFRAGSFGMNADTFGALTDVGIEFDSSFNGMAMPSCANLHQLGALHQPRWIEGVWEYPISLFIDGTGGRRHAQLGACSYRELEWLLWRAAEQGWESVVILSHNFELLNIAKTRSDPIVDARFSRLCRFLSDNSDTFQTCGFRDLVPQPIGEQPELPRSTRRRTLARITEQAWRRLYG